jgi:hypothetical protein
MFFIIFLELIFNWILILMNKNGHLNNWIELILIFLIVSLCAFLTLIAFIYDKMRTLFFINFRNLSMNERTLFFRFAALSKHKIFTCEFLHLLFLLRYYLLLFCIFFLIIVSVILLIYIIIFLIFLFLCTKIRGLLFL